MQIMTELIILILTGSFIGILSGLLGIGGGLIIVPLLTFVLMHFHDVAFNQAMIMAIGTSLASIIFTAAMSSYFHKKRNNMDWSIAVNYIPGVLLGASIMALIIPHLNIAFIKHSFVIYTFIAAYEVVKSPKIKSLVQLPTLVLANFYGFILGSISTMI